MDTKREDILTKSTTKPQSKDQLLLAQSKTKEICFEIYNSLKIGQNASEAKEMAIRIFKNYGVFKWHDVMIHFGRNSNYGSLLRDQIDQSLTYDQNEIVFIDIGVVINKTLEGDYGQTFYSGRDIRYNNLINMSRYLWQFGKQLWLQNKTTITGVELYKRIGEEAGKSGYILKPEAGAKGHQVGIFLHHGPKLCTYPLPLEENLWILEIFVYDQQIDRGAFYEDALMVLDEDKPSL